MESTGRIYSLEQVRIRRMEGTTGGMLMLIFTRWTVTTRYSSYLYLYEIEAFVHDERLFRSLDFKRDMWVES